ncbi:hypothetical protein AX17_000674 [Amanita inopinata Kibby_2008]|nr:hypothetical protein AX17_000674 [Amanita inopinata Kibby_2008]
MLREIHDAPSYDSHGDITSNAFSQRRIRHITSIQIRNLTPFPLRDIFTSAIAKPSQQPQFTPYGQLSDDLDLTISKKRPRKLSTNSVKTRRNIRSDANDQIGVEHIIGSMSEARGRRRSDSQAEFLDGSPARRYSASTSTQRPRAASTVSIRDHLTAPTGNFNSSTAMLPDTSQGGLENIIKSRLVETCLVIALFRDRSALDSSLNSRRERTFTPAQSAASSSSFQGRSNVNPKDPSTNSRVASRRPAQPSDKVVLRRESVGAARPTSSKTNGHAKVVTHVKSASSPSHRRRDSAVVGSHHRSPQIASSSTMDQDDMYTSLKVCARYISPIHRPSTSPTFPFDSNLLDDDPLNFTGHKLKIEAWGRLGLEDNSVHVRNKGKEKQTEMDTRERHWRVIGQWLVDLEELIPLPPDVEAQTSLPPNTILVTLLPFGQVYYIRPPHDTTLLSPSPPPGYASDPETEAKEMSYAYPTSGRNYRQKRHQHSSSQDSDSQVIAKSATWQDLCKLLHLQSCIDDGFSALLNTQRDIDKSIQTNIPSALMREVSQRSIIIEGLREDRSTIWRNSIILKEQIELRIKKIQERREVLRRARHQLAELRWQQDEREADITQERTQLGVSRGQFTPIRTALISTLSTIFPIELCSSPDLLYAILDVPLPIPLSTSDPGPPLSMPTQKSVNEETVATALGYVAQVAQLTAAYLGKALIYPVVCIGSRSLIKDNISAMVGPRMFPLFSKGVDTYRFEYGVFLLNKNIEMLMTDRDLRALDTRHTLPNLKNLMLTLTHGEAAQLPASKHAASPMTSLNDLESVVNVESESEATTPKLSSHGTQMSLDGDTPPASGDTTPTAASTMIDATKTTRSFLALSSLTDFIRVRYPSSNRAQSVVSDAVEGTNVTEGGHDNMIPNGETTEREATKTGDELQEGEEMEMEVEVGNETCDDGNVIEDKLPLSPPPTATLGPTVQGK